MRRRRARLVPLSVVALVVASCGSSGGGATGEIVGRVVSVDTARAHAIIRVTCGRRQGSTVDIDIRSSSFEIETDPAHPASGHVDSVSLDEWARADLNAEWVVLAYSGKAQIIRSATAPSDHDPCNG